MAARRTMAPDHGTLWDRRVAGATGRLDFKDDVENAVFYYRGHLTLG